MTKIKSVLAVLIAIFMIFASGCSLVEKKPEAVQKQNVAKVGSEYITRAELDNLFSFVKEQMIAQSPGFDANSQEGKDAIASQKRDLLQTMMDQKLLEQKANELKLFKDENEIKDEVKKLIDAQYKNGKSDEDYNKWLSDLKLTPEILDIIAKYQVIGEKVYDNVTKDVTVSDQDVKTYYDSNQSSFTEKPNTMTVSHILVAADKEDLAKEIKAKLDKGEDFKTLSDQYSIDEAAKADGGSLGEIQYNDYNYDQIFMAAAMALKEGQISDPVQTNFGWHIIKVTKKTEYPILPLDKVKDEIQQQLLTDKKNSTYTDLLKQWKDKAGVETYDQNIDNQK